MPNRTRIDEDNYFGAGSLYELLDLAKDKLLRLWIVHRRVWLEGRVQSAAGNLVEDPVRWERKIHRTGLTNAVSKRTQQ